MDNLEHNKTIKTYVLRAGRMTVSQKKNYELLKNKWCVSATEILDFEKIFGNTNPVVIEIGFGMGDATAIIAAQNPNINYLGLEVHTPGVAKLLGLIEEYKLTNLRIIQNDAIDIMSLVPNNSVSGFHIFFPDPWPKKKHFKRRMIQAENTNLFTTKLLNDGYLYFVTDWEPYGLFAKEQLDLTVGLKNKFETFAPHQEWRPETKFERKGVSAERKIYELYYLANKV